MKRLLSILLAATLCVGNAFVMAEENHPNDENEIEEVVLEEDDNNTPDGQENQQGEEADILNDTENDETTAGNNVEEETAEDNKGDITDTTINDVDQDAETTISDENETEITVLEEIQIETLDTSEEDAAYEEALRNLQNSKQEKEAAEETYNNILSEQETKQASFNSASKAYTEAAEELSQKETDKQQKTTKFNEASVNLETAKQNVQTAKNNAEEENKNAAATVQAALNELNAKEQTVLEAQAVINKGTLGFFNDNAGTEDNAAAKIINRAIEDQENGTLSFGTSSTGWSVKYQDNMLTNIGAEGDATSLENMKHSIELIKEMNAYRVSEGLGKLKVTDAIMALAEVEANIEYGLYKDYGIPHNSVYTSGYSVGENVAWGLTDPFAGWYVTEKIVYDYQQENKEKVLNYMNTYNEENNADITIAQAAVKLMVKEYMEEKNVSEIEAYISLGGGIAGVKSTGHYTNITSKAAQYAGIGVRTKTENDAAGNSLNTITMNTGSDYFYKYFSDDKAYTDDEYEALFNAYYEKVMKELADATTARDAAKASYDTAVNAQSEKKTALETAVTEAENAYDLAVETYNNTKQEMESAEALYNAAVSKVNECKSSFEAAKAALDDINVQLETAGTALSEKQQAYDDALEAMKQFSSYRAKLRLGDVDNSGGIDVSDIIKIRDIILGDPNTINNLSEEDKLAADVNQDNKVDVSDIILVRDRILGVVDEEYKKKS